MNTDHLKYSTEFWTLSKRFMLYMCIIMVPFIFQTNGIECTLEFRHKIWFIWKRNSKLHLSENHTVHKVTRSKLYLSRDIWLPCRWWRNCKRFKFHFAGFGKLMHVYEKHIYCWSDISKTKHGSGIYIPGIYIVQRSVMHCLEQRCTTCGLR